MPEPERDSGRPLAPGGRPSESGAITATALDPEAETAGVRMSFEHRLAGSSLPDLFAFHANPANLAVLLRGWPGFRLMRHEGSIEPGNRTWVCQCVMRLLPVVMALRHGPCEPPERFQEESVRGPFRRFFHVHEFLSEGEHVVVRDSLDVQVPWYLGGELAMRLLVCPYFRRFFAFRHRALSELARQGSWPRATAGA